MIDPSSVQLVEGVPQPATGQPLQQAVLGTGHYLSEEFRFLASKVAGLAKERFTTIGVVSTGPSEGKTTVALGLAAALSRISQQRALLLEADNRVTYAVNSSGFETQFRVAHVHIGSPDVAGPILFPLDCNENGTSCSGTSPPLADEELAALNAGNTYVNLHTDQFAGGEIRGQVVPAPGGLAALAMAGMAAMRRRRR